MGMKQKKNQPTQINKILKTANFQKNFGKFHGLVLGLLVLIDAKGIDVTKPIWS
jgi:hypothetical protein